MSEKTSDYEKLKKDIRSSYLYNVLGYSSEVLGIFGMAITIAKTVSDGFPTNFLPTNLIGLGAGIAGYISGRVINEGVSTWRAEKEAKLQALEESLMPE